MPLSTDRDQANPKTNAGQNLTDEDTETFVRITARLAANRFLLNILNRRLQQPLAEIDKQVARIERLAQKVARS